MYADGGHLYVFLVYGMHHCANVVTRARRRSGGRPPAGRGGAGRRAGSAHGGPREALRGARRSRTAHSGLDLLAGPLGILVPRRRPRLRLGVSPRIGIDYAGDAKDWPLRFYDADSPAVSR